jgi:glycosyltransferase involved in cell wall biosynthesis
LTVGYLIERKGHHLVIEALQRLPQFQLVVVGSGPERKALDDLAQRLGVAERVQFVGTVPQSELYLYYSAADVLVLASSREGWANVLLEAMACGTPVVATRIWGTPEVVTAPVAGRLAGERTAGALSEAVRDLFGNLPSRSDVRRYAEQFGWAETTQGQIELFRSIVNGASGDLLTGSAGTASN